MLIRLLCSLFLTTCLQLRAASVADEKPVLVSTSGGTSDRDDPYFRAIDLLQTEGAPDAVAQGLLQLEQLAKEGDSRALFRLGKLFADGDRVPADLTKAYHYYLQAAQAGVAEAQHNLGAMLVSGRGIKRDWVEGLAWLIVASRNGADSASENQTRAHLTQRRRTTLIENAEKRALELMAPPSPTPTPSPTPARPALSAPVPPPSGLGLPAPLPPGGLSLALPPLPSPTPSKAPPSNP